MLSSTASSNSVSLDPMAGADDGRGLIGTEAVAVLGAGDGGALISAWRWMAAMVFTKNVRKRRLVFGLVPGLTSSHRCWHRGPAVVLGAIETGERLLVHEHAEVVAETVHQLTRSKLWSLERLAFKHRGHLELVRQLIVTGGRRNA